MLIPLVVLELCPGKYMYVDGQTDIRTDVRTEREASIIVILAQI